MDDDSLIKGIAPTRVGHEAPLTQKDFKPWHKPRKQWVRSNQWIKEIDMIIPKIKFDGRPLRYLSLPGEDLLDIRLVATLCKDKGLLLKCLGYDDSAGGKSSQIEVSISWNEVSNNIDIDSTILSDNISVLKNKSSQGFNYINSHGPFDVINLDFCKSISCITSPDNHQVLKNLCEFQINSIRQPWLLFLTTRAEYEKVNTEHIPSYLNILKTNAGKYASFNEMFERITQFNIINYDLNEPIEKISTHCNGVDFVKLFSIGFGKWLLELMIKSRISWKVEMLDSYWYRVADNHKAGSYPNMLSLAYCFIPTSTPLVDISGLSHCEKPLIIDEEQLANIILEKTNQFIDLDRELYKDTALYNEMVEQSASLLKDARYSVAGYHSWAESKKICFN